MWGAAVAASLLFSSQVFAGAIGNDGLRVRKAESLDARAKRLVNTLVEPVAESRTLTKRVTNVTDWNLETEAACTSALSLLNGSASNPSGMAVCYNIPSLDSSTGVFEADLRLYMIAPATGDFAQISTQDVSVGLNYAGAAVSPVNATQLKRSTGESLISWPRSENGVNKRAADPIQAQQYYFVGQINQAQLSAGVSNNSTLERLVTPQVTLTGTATNGQTVNTVLSSADATFVYGVFAKQVSDGTTFVKSEAAVAPIQTLVTASDAPFVLPGTAILIEPVGAIITGLWAFLFVSTVGYGTFGRMQFRDQFKSRSIAASRSDTTRI